MEALLSAAPLWFMQVFTNLLRVEEGGAALLTEQHLMVRDRDTRWEGLRVELQATPLHGHLELRGRALQRREGFTLQDLKELRVRSEVKGQWNAMQCREMSSNYMIPRTDGREVQRCGGGA